MATIGKSVPTLLVHYHVFEIYRRMLDIDDRGRHMRVRGRDLAQGARRDDTEQTRRRWSMIAVGIGQQEAAVAERCLVVHSDGEHKSLVATSKVMELDHFCGHARAVELNGGTLLGGKSLEHDVWCRGALLDLRDCRRSAARHKKIKILQLLRGRQGLGIGRDARLT